MPRKSKTSEPLSSNLAPALYAGALSPQGGTHAQSARPKPLLFVGDPHVTSQRIARRIDDYISATLDKLEQSVLLANRLDARMVVLGDLFDRPREADISLLSRLIGVLRGLKEPALVLAGNHDMAGTFLTEDTTLALLGRAGVVQVIDQPQQLHFSGVSLFCVPHGCPLPSLIDRPQGLSVMISHHDLAIAPNLNPHAVPPVPVAGCDLVVNGHDHTFKPAVTVGATLYFNPGNISRVSIAQLNHRPAVFVLSPPELTGADAAQDVADPASSLFDAKPGAAVLEVGGWMMQRYELSCASGEEVFDMTGYNAKASSDDALADYLAEFTRSSQEKFIQALVSTTELQAAGGGDAVEKIVREVMDDMNVSQVVRQILEEKILRSEGAEVPAL